MYDAKEDTLTKDWMCRSHPTLAVVSSINGIASSWNSIWDEVLEYGKAGTVFGMKYLSMVLGVPGTCMAHMEL